MPWPPGSSTAVCPGSWRTSRRSGCISLPGSTSARYRALVLGRPCSLVTGSPPDPRMCGRASCSSRRLCLRSLTCFTCRASTDVRNVWSARHPCRSGAGQVPSGGRDLSFRFLRQVWARRAKASGSRIGRRPTAERPEVLDADAGRCMLFTAEKMGWFAPGVDGGWSGACSSPVSRVWTGPVGGCRSSLRRAVAAWSAATGAVGRDQSDGATSPGVGVMTCATRVRPRSWGDHALVGCRQRICPSRSP